MIQDLSHSIDTIIHNTARTVQLFTPSRISAIRSRSRSHCSFTASFPNPSLSFQIQNNSPFPTFLSFPFLSIYNIVLLLGLLLANRIHPLLSLSLDIPIIDSTYIHLGRNNLISNQGQILRSLLQVLLRLCQLGPEQINRFIICIFQHDISSKPQVDNSGCAIDGCFSVEHIGEIVARCEGCFFCGFFGF